MHADIQGALNYINKSWKAFEHNGESMTKAQVKALLTYGLSKGYKYTSEFKDSEVDRILELLRRKVNNTYYASNPQTKSRY